MSNYIKESKYEIKKSVFPLSKIFKGFVFANKIYLRPDIYNDLYKDKPKPESVGVLIHERTHLEQISSGNWLIQGLRYWIFPKVRLESELLANREQFKYLKRNKEIFDFEKRAKHLSSFPYLFCSSYQSALKELRKIWRNV
ncbi:MAG: hypothetical protein UT24_C0002G0024 [Candidatus Woesebacteria bacterium GW2011_GWB1_39_12]|uniref:DUF4157 domain-containing protein n=2 Tax=Candidatus Woeseibacteriota TaxID=1752722 RepID=A0A0G0PGN8_9BACT|nr:MAG: hypothetical protein UT23_C0014G0010 [Candidatus Woesebacteria bacterium GW2011_GWA1_39_12]KKR01761.1 MAG: hypothetical protein UT24_C0002G0024 [Candidatus Woesebacteria bacterium GW2011_GWB1_39_12]